MFTAAEPEGCLGQHVDDFHELPQVGNISCSLEEQPLTSSSARDGKSAASFHMKCRLRPQPPGVDSGSVDQLSGK